MENENLENKLSKDEKREAKRIARKEVIKGVIITSIIVGGLYAGYKLVLEPALERGSNTRHAAHFTYTLF